MRVTAETKGKTHERILAAAQKLLSEHGFEAMTTRDIARAAGIAVGTLFNYFATKEAVVTCLVNQAVWKAQPEFERRAEEAAPSDELSLEEELFAHVAAGLRKLKPFRKHLTPL